MHYYIYLSTYNVIFCNLKFKIVILASVQITLFYFIICSNSTKINI